MRKTRRQRKLSRKTMLRKRVRGGGEKIRIVKILQNIDDVSEYMKYSKENEALYFFPPPSRLTRFLTRDISQDQTRSDGEKINGNIEVSEKGTLINRYDETKLPVTYSYLDSRDSVLKTIPDDDREPDKHIFDGKLVVGEPV